MKKLILFFLLFLPFFSCNLEEQMKKMGEIETDLKKKFNHDQISLIHHWGTEIGGNYLQVSFYEYDMDSIPYSEIESTADSVFRYIKPYKVEFGDLNFIQVRFTKEKDEDAGSFINFKSNVLN